MKLTAQTLRKHASIPFNPDLARVFFLAGKIEAWGSGIERMLTACAEHGCPEPVFRNQTIELRGQIFRCDIQGIIIHGRGTSYHRDLLRTVYFLSMKQIDETKGEMDEV